MTTTQSSTRHPDQSQTACRLTPKNHPLMGSFNCRQWVSVIVVVHLLFFDVHSIHKGLEPHLVLGHATHTQVGDGDAEEAV